MPHLAIVELQKPAILKAAAAETALFLLSFLFIFLQAGRFGLFVLRSAKSFFNRVIWMGWCIGLDSGL